MSRYEHWLACGGRPTYPSRVIAVECQGRMEPIDATGHREAERLVSWNMATMKGDKGCYGKAKGWGGGDLESFWSAILPWQSQNGLTYVYGWRIMRQLSLLGAFRRIEEGRLKLAGTDARNHYNAPNCWSQSGQGYCVMEDPPTVILTRLPESKGVTVWLDTRNFGVDRNLEPEDNGAWCQLLLCWIRDMTDGMKVQAVGGWKHTAASMAYASWKFCGLNHSVLAHTHKTALDLERRAYYGGRCECYFIGDVEGPVYHLDVRSMYPYLCQKHYLPARLIGCWHSEESAARHIDLARDAVIVDATIRTDHPSYPVRGGTHTVWPVGKFRTCMCGPEYYDCVQTQRIVSCHAIAAYETDPILSQWMGLWYGIRKQAETYGNAMVASTCKAVMNCLPGKLGQRECRWHDDDRVISDTPWGCWHSADRKGNAVRYRSLDWRVQREVVDGQHPESIPAVSAYVTSLGRMYLLRMIREAGSHNTYYVDTDSLMCNEVGYRNLCKSGHVKDGAWGKLQIKGVHNSLTVKGVKHYILDGEVTCSGCPSSPQSQGPTADTVWISRGAISALSDGQAPDTERRVRHFARDAPYRLGNVGPSGWVHPYLIGE